MGYSALIGRIFFASIFVLAALGHFSSQEIAFAAAQGVPLASIIVPFSGLIALIGGLSIAFGYKARLGAVLVILFLIPVTIMIPELCTQRLLSGGGADWVVLAST